MKKIEPQRLICKNHFSLRERWYIQALEKAFRKNDIPENYYSLYGYGESCICLQKRGNMWSVFEGEREMEFNAENFICIEDACEDIIKRISNSSNLLKMKRDFKIALDPLDLAIQEVGEMYENIVASLADYKSKRTLMEEKSVQRWVHAMECREKKTTQKVVRGIKCVNPAKKESVLQKNANIKAKRKRKKARK